MKVITERLESPAGSLTAYLHDKSNELLSAAVRPAMLIFPGGGYFNCSDREAEPIALAYAAEGYNAFVVRYSVGEDAQFPDALKDAESAIALLHRKADEWDIDKSKIAAIGFSAGGHLASALATMGSTRPNALVLGYPVILASMGQLLGKELPSTNEHVDENTPPTFLFSTRDDKVVPIKNSLAFVDALDEAGVPFEAHIFASGDHGLSLAKPLTANGLRGMNNPAVQKWLGLSIEWLKGIFGDFTAEYEMPMFDMDSETIGLDTPLYILMEHDEYREVLERLVPVIMEAAKSNEMTKMASLRIIANNAPDLLPDDVMRRVESELQQGQ